MRHTFLQNLIKMKKIYGVAGMVEWNALIPVGRGTVKVHFEGGSFTSYGMAPAEYGTTNKAMQKIIESSRYFKSGKITLLRTLTTENDGSIAKNCESVQKINSIKQVAVDSPDDAKDYLEKYHGVDRVRLKTKSAIDATAKSHGVEFKYP